MMRLLLLIASLTLPLPAAADYSRHPRAQQLIAELVEGHGFDAAALRRQLASAEKQPKLIAAERNAAERRLSWPEYRAIFIQPDRIEGGVAFLRKHRATFAAVEREYGVPPAVIAAIIGVETRYGGYTGPHRVLDSLATQGFDHPSRQPFFYSELKAFFLACREHGLDPLTVTGSYAGAMGLPQFMPSNYRRLAVDFDRNGRVDLWSADDAIASAANYLRRFRGALPGWEQGAPVTLPASVPAKAATALGANTKTAPYRLAELAEWGIRAETAMDGRPAGLIRLQTEAGEAWWLAFDNFYNLMAYNPRTYYAMAVWSLAQEIGRAAEERG